MTSPTWTSIEARFEHRLTKIEAELVAAGMLVSETNEAVKELRDHVKMQNGRIGKLEIFRAMLIGAIIFLLPALLILGAIITIITEASR